MRIRLGDGREVPFSEVAVVKTGRGYSSIRRVDGRRSVNITADIDSTKTESNKVVASLRQKICPNWPAGTQVCLPDSRERARSRRKRWPV